MLANPKETSDLITFTEEILSGKLLFLCSALPLGKPRVVKNIHP